VPVTDTEPLPVYGRADQRTVTAVVPPAVTTNVADPVNVPCSPRRTSPSSAMV
jgi:hypothetical protein